MNYFDDTMWPNEFRDDSGREWDEDTNPRFLTELDFHPADLD